MIAKTGEKPLYGARLEKLPVKNMTLTELAQLYAFLVHKHGEGSPLTLDPIKELDEKEWGAAAFNAGKDEGKAEGYADGCADGKDDGYDEGQADGHADGYDEGKGDGYAEGYNIGLEDSDARYDEGFNDGAADSDTCREEGYGDGYDAAKDEFEVKNDQS
jgi:flagellar biosynthesis/type III secretory pathway protein FliH